MNTKNVIIIDDEKDFRIPFQETLTRRGFRVQGAATVEDAHRVIEQSGDETDVMVLDMELSDPCAPTTTGADIAIQIRDRHREWTPEYLIKTGFPTRVNYYRLAIRLGVAAYLVWGEVSQPDVVRHIRALTLKRSLRVERPSVMAKLSAIAHSTKNLSEAVRRFCQEMLAPELTACLGTPYMLLLTDERGTQNAATNTSLPTERQSSYGAIQKMAHAITKLSPYVMAQADIENLMRSTSDVDAGLRSRLTGAALVPLAKVGHFGLSLALLAAQSDERFPEDTEALASVLVQHVRPSIFEHFLGILVHLNSQKQAMLKSTSYFCLYVGQEQERILNEGTVRREVAQESVVHRRLSTMADDLRQTGNILNSAVSQPNPPLSIIEMGDLIQREFTDLKEMGGNEGLELLLDGTCHVSAGDDLSVAVKRLLQWLAQRSSEVPLGEKRRIYVRCLEEKEDSKIIFEDCSRKLGATLRELLFEPFSTSLPADTHDSGPGLYLPLYLAKVLVEEKYGGQLKDESDTIEGDIGHRLVMVFSVPKPSLTDAAVP